MPQKFETEILVRPHEIDWNRHVNQSVYLDYLLHASRKSFLTTSGANTQSRLTLMPISFFSLSPF